MKIKIKKNPDKKKGSRERNLRKGKIDLNIFLFELYEYLGYYSFQKS